MGVAGSAPGALALKTLSHLRLGMRFPFFLEEMHKEQAAVGIHSWVADEAWLDLALRCLGIKVSKA